MSLPSLVFFLLRFFVDKYFFKPFLCSSSCVVECCLCWTDHTHVALSSLGFSSDISSSKTPKGFSVKIKSSLMFIRRGHRLLFVSFDSNKHCARETWEYFMRELNSICRNSGFAFKWDTAYKCPTRTLWRGWWGLTFGFYKNTDFILFLKLFSFLSFFFLLRYTLHETQISFDIDWTTLANRRLEWSFFSCYFSGWIRFLLKKISSKQNWIRQKFHDVRPKI